MVRYRTRPGVVLTYICGEYVLVAAKSILSVCPYVTQVNETSAFLWQHLVDGATTEQLEAAVSEEYEVDDPAQLRDAIDSFIRQMLELNYLLSDNQGGNDET